MAERDTVPWDGDIAGSEQTAEREPERIGQREIVDVLFAGRRVLADGPPARLGPAVHREEHQRHGDEDGADGGPDFGGQRRHEAEEARLLFHRLLDHDRDAQLHERRAKVHHALARRRDRDAPQTNVRLLF